MDGMTEGGKGEGIIYWVLACFGRNSMRSSGGHRQENFHPPSPSRFDQGGHRAGYVAGHTKGQYAMNRHKITITSYYHKWFGEILHIWEPMLTRNIWYVNCRTQEEFIAIVKRRLNITVCQDGGNPVARFCVVEKNGRQAGLLWCPKKDIPNLAHECLHAVMWIMSSLHVRPAMDWFADDTNSDEQYCYLLTFLMKTILENG